MKRFLLFLLIAFNLNAFAQIPTNGLVAYYPFNGNANDLSGNNQHGTVNGATLTTDRFGNLNSAYSFNGSSSYISCPSLSALNGSYGLTFVAWVKIDGTNPQYIVSRSSDNNDHFSLYYNADYFGACIKTPTQHPSLLSLNGYPVPQPKWHMIVLTLDAGKQNFYVDGVFQKSVDWTFPFYSSTDNVLIGRHIKNDYPYFVNGQIDDVGFWNRALTESEITMLYHDNGYAGVSDNDGNVYNTVKIENQTWMAENLKTTKYNDGTNIPLVTNASSWSNLSSPGYCWANNDETSNKNVYGALYNFYTVVTNKTCPIGWHVPSDNDWTILQNYLGGDAVAGGKMKQIGIAHWMAPNEGATNESGFNALPGGVRDEFGTFQRFSGDWGYYWTSSIYNESLALDRYLVHNDGYLRTSGDNKRDGLSIRCLKDNFSLTVSNTTVNEGQSIEVLISSGEFISSDNIISYQFDINFDNTSLAYTSNSLIGTLADGGTALVNSSVAGKLSISYMKSSAMIGIGNILKLQFNPLKVGVTPITMSNALLNAIPVDNITNGAVTIIESTPPSAALSYNDNDIRFADNLLITATFSEPMKAANAVKLTLSGAATLSATDMVRQSETVYTYTYAIPKVAGVVNVALSNGTDIAGNTVVSAPTSGGNFTVVALRYGDVDDNAKIQAYDAALALQYSISLDPLPMLDPTPWENWRIATANVDGVGNITANDASEILKYSVGLITQFPVQSGKKSYDKANADVSITVENGNIVFKSSGDLFGLNVFVNENKEVLGSPVFLNQSLITATNITTTSYAIGICTPTALAEGMVFMKIPFTVTSIKSITFELIVNTETKQFNIGLLTGIVETKDTKRMIYPNPVRDVLYLNGAAQNVRINIYDINGRLMMENQSKDNQVNVSKLPNGIYLIKVYDKNAIECHRFVKE